MSEACVRVVPMLSPIERYEQRTYARRKKPLTALRTWKRWHPFRRRPASASDICKISTR